MRQGEASKSVQIFFFFFWEGKVFKLEFVPFCHIIFPLYKSGNIKAPQNKIIIIIIIKIILVTLDIKLTNGQAKSSYLN